MSTPSTSIVLPSGLPKNIPKKKAVPKKHATSKHKKKGIRKSHDQMILESDSSGSETRDSPVVLSVPNSRWFSNKEEIIRYAHIPLPKLQDQDSILAQFPSLFTLTRDVSQHQDKSPVQEITDEELHTLERGLFSYSPFEHISTFGVFSIREDIQASICEGKEQLYLCNDEMNDSLPDFPGKNSAELNNISITIHHSPSLPTDSTPPEPVSLPQDILSSLPQAQSDLNVEKSTPASTLDESVNIQMKTEPTSDTLSIKKEAVNTTSANLKSNNLSLENSIDEEETKALVDYSLFSSSESSITSDNETIASIIQQQKSQKQLLQESSDSETIIDSPQLRRKRRKLQALKRMEKRNQKQKEELQNICNSLSDQKEVQLLMSMNLSIVDLPPLSKPKGVSQKQIETNQHMDRLASSLVEGTKPINLSKQHSHFTDLFPNYSLVQLPALRRSVNKKL